MTGRERAGHRPAPRRGPRGGGAAARGGHVAAHDEDAEPVTRDLVLLSVATGVAGGLVLGGEIYRGATGAAGQLGHTILGLDLGGAVPAPMGFPQPGSLEYVASGHA